MNDGITMLSDVSLIMHSAIAPTEHLLPSRIIDLYAELSLLGVAMTFAPNDTFPHDAPAWASPGVTGDFLSLPILEKAMKRAGFKPRKGFFPTPRSKKSFYVEAVMDTHNKKQALVGIQFVFDSPNFETEYSSFQVFW